MALRIFVAHPSSLVTDHRPHGDGLVAFGFISELAARGHELHVAAEGVDLRDPLPPNVHLHPLGSRRGPAPLDRLSYMWRMRRLYRRLSRARRFDVVHQLNPVDAGLTLAVADTAVPVVLGPYVPDWPQVAKPSGHRAVLAAQQRLATTVLLSTPAAASRLAIRRPGGPKVRVVPHGIDAGLWAPAPG